MNAKTLTRGLAALLLVLFATVAFGATNDATMALQKALFEEEANHDLKGAIRDYQAVVRQFDQDRKLAATAVFRLGECYRKQGNTNDANVQYQRILREFSDQAELVALSRSYLQAAGHSATVEPAGTTPATSEEAQEVQRIRAMIKDSPDLINARDALGQTPLHHAADKGQLVVATFLLENGADVNAKDNIGQTPLHLATVRGHKAMVELLLDHRADVQAMRGDNDAPTALHIAAEKGFRSLLELLLAHKAEVNAKGPNGVTPLHLAVSNGFKAIAEVLIQNGADVNASASSYLHGTFNGTPLNVAAQRGNKTISKLLLDNKADPNSATLPGGTTPLHVAAMGGSDAVAKLLLAYGAKVNARDDSGTTPLAFAVQRQQLHVTATLLEAKADPNTPFAFSPPVLPVHMMKRAPLYCAVQEGSPEIVGLLLKNGANPNQEDEDAQQCPLLEAARKQGAVATEMISSLLDNKADPNLLDRNGNDALQLAIAQPAIIEMLLAHGANPNSRNNFGETPLHWGAGAGLTNSAELLLSHGAHINTRDNAGNTPLHFAVLAGRQPMVEFLLAKGANPNILNREGKTPLDWAKIRSSRPTVILIYVARDIWFARPQAGGSPGFGMPPGGSFANLSSEATEAMTTALESHGAIQNLPHLDRIEVARAATHYSRTIFMKGTNDWNHFHLLDVIGVTYGLLADDPGAGVRGFDFPYVVGLPNNNTTSVDQRLGFPDLTHLRIRKPSPDLKTWQEQVVNIAGVFSAGICTNNPALAWGDIVDIPEADHPLNNIWNGLSTAELTNLVNCLACEVEVVSKGTTNQVRVGPHVSLDPVGQPRFRKPTMWLKPALEASNLLMTSSDLSRVKVIRREANGQTHQWVLDCSDGKPAPAFWLENGDIIEVPEKP